MNLAFFDHFRRYCSPSLTYCTLIWEFLAAYLCPVHLSSCSNDFYSDLVILNGGCISPFIFSLKYVRCAFP